MALKGIKVPRKKKAQRVNRKTGFEDVVWEGCERWSGEKFHRLRRGAIDNYYQLTKPSDNYVYIWEYMKENGWTKDDIRCAKAAKNPSPYVAIYARLMNLGMPGFHKKQNEYWNSLAGTNGDLRDLADYLKERITLMIEEGSLVVEQKEAEARAEEAAKGKIYKPSIQEVVREASFVMAEEIDDVVEEFIRDKDIAAVKKFDPLRSLRAKSAKPNHARNIRKLYENELEEMKLVNNIPKPAQIKKMSDAEQDEWAQIKEGYAHLDAKTAKAALELFEKIINACDIVIAEAKSTRKPRKVKAKSPEALVSKLKFKPSDADFGIASVDPAKLVGAVCALVFNTKTRKFGIYVSKTSDGFGVKGTTLTEFNEDNSLQRTVRKPAEFLPQVKKTTKAKALKQFDTLKTTETKLNGRFNADTIILATYK